MALKGNAAKAEMQYVKDDVGLKLVWLRYGGLIYICYDEYVKYIILQNL